MEPTTQEIVLDEIRRDLAKVDKRIYGNGSGTPGLIERQIAVESRLGNVEKALAEVSTSIKRAAPQAVTIKGVPVVWWLIGIQLLVIVALAAFIMHIDVAKIAQKGATVAIESTVQGVANADGGS